MICWAWLAWDSRATALVGRSLVASYFYYSRLIERWNREKEIDLEKEEMKTQSTATEWKQMVCEASVGWPLPLRTHCKFIELHRVNQVFKRAATWNSGRKKSPNLWCERRIWGWWRLSNYKSPIRWEIERFLRNNKFVAVEKSLLRFTRRRRDETDSRTSLASRARSQIQPKIRINLISFYVIRIRSNHKSNFQSLLLSPHVE